MYEKRKNSDKRAGLSSGLAVLLLLAGLFVGMNLTNLNQAQDAEITESALVAEDVDLNGEWIGTITEDYGIEARYDFRLELEQRDDVVTGMSFLDMAQEPEIYSESPIAGIVTGDVFTFTQVSTTVLENISMDNWCLADMTVSYQLLDGQETLVGTWELAHHEREECGDVTGRIILTRQPE